MSDETVRTGPVDLSREPDFCLGTWEIRPSTREVIRGDHREVLEPKAMQVLVVLHQAAGRVVSRDDLIARCWEGRIVGEDAINRVIWRLRRLSEGDGGASLAIETIPKVGYRLPVPPEKKAPAAALQTLPEPVVPAAPPRSEPIAAPTAYSNASEPASGNLLYRHWLAAASLLVAAALALAVWLLLPARPVETSVAVLPFVNLSGDPKQEFFSDGMTEEITSALAKVPGLTVIGRTSAFQFKGENKDMRAIGQALGAKNLIEGSVRKAGDQLRITAQLVKATDGTDLWTESYDRKLTDVFAVQEDIATAIAGALQVPLGLKQGQNLVSHRTTDTKSYEAYLRAKELFRARGATNFTEATNLLEQVTARDPNYAPAWGLLANVYALAPVYQSTAYVTANAIRQARDTDLPEAEATARKAIAADVNNSEAWTALGLVQSQRRNFIEAEDSYKRALQLDPRNVSALHDYAHNLAGTGRLREALEIRRQTVVLDSLDTRLKEGLARVLADNGQYDSAIAMMKNLPDASLGLAQIYAAAGRFKEAADALLTVAPGYYPAGTVEIAARLLRAVPAQVTSPQDLPAFPRPLTFVYLYVGAASRALEYSEAEVKTGYLNYATDVFWYPAAASLRKTERFKALMHNAGFVDYWRARGWPDLCHPVGADDFACQ